MRAATGANRTPCRHRHRAVAPDPKSAPRFTGSEFIAADGQRLPLRTWLPAGPVKAVILALHGFNDYSRAFAAPGKAWASDGIATYAYDQRGFGAAPERGLWPGRAALAADAATACKVLRRRYPGVPLYLLGESMGGAVAVVAMTGESGTPIPEVDGIILTAPAVWGRSTMDLAERVALWIGVRLMPGLTLTGQSLHILASDNIPMLRALGRDPLVIKETRVDYDLGSGQSDGCRARFGAAAASAFVDDVRRPRRDHPKAFDPPVCPRPAASTRATAACSPITGTATTCCCAISTGRWSPPMWRVGFAIRARRCCRAPIAAPSKPI